MFVSKLIKHNDGRLWNDRTNFKTIWLTVEQNSLTKQHGKITSQSWLKLVFKLVLGNFAHQNSSLWKKKFSIIFSFAGILYAKRASVWSITFSSNWDSWCLVISRIADETDVKHVLFHSSNKQGYIRSHFHSFNANRLWNTGLKLWFACK